MNRLLRTLTMAMLLLGPWWTGSASGQTAVPSSEVEALRQEIQKLQDRLNRLEQSQRAAPPVAAPVPSAEDSST